MLNHINVIQLCDSAVQLQPVYLKMTRNTTLSVVSVVGRLEANVALRLRVRGEGRLLVHVGHIAGIGGVRGRGVGSRVVGRRGVRRGVGGVKIRWRLCVGWDGNLINTTAETTQGKVG